ncbi:unnamed protein product [Phaedon cochleariae]|uniref:G-protein coupled receptors family 1 profile domain-containing protein n=1 Tax=Phaedon cochleariae TaxID=80249 RepID=A0A9N9SLI3_PHACE|nr:unnamed protein product [Phaedon cochleariae]
MDEAEMTSQAILDNSRFYVQKVLIPILLCLGVAGSIVTVMVLTRRRMRSSTNTYLSALAVADIIQLIFGFLLSFEHYNNIHDKKYELYWRFYGLTHWLCDAASATSAWLAVSFTVERYVAVCHPMKGKQFCTERRAKSVIVVVYVFCLLTTVSTAFEYQLTFREECLERCPSTSEARNESYFLDEYNIPRSVAKAAVEEAGVGSNCTVILFPLYFLRQSRPPPGLNATFDNHTSKRAVTDVNMSEDLSSDRNETSLENVTCCVQNLTIFVESTDLGKSKVYTDFIYWYSALFFGMIPLALIATFNCFLVRAVYLSQKIRRVMTNSQDNVSFANERRITTMLIGIVFIFIICNAPTASYLIYSHFHKPKNKVDENVTKILGNFFNLLLMLNAPCNFLIYCLLSRKFRSTFWKIFWQRRIKKAKLLEAETMLLSSMKSKDRFNPYRHGLMKRNASEYKTPRNLETQSLTSMPRSKSLMVRPMGKAKSSDLNV